MFRKKQTKTYELSLLTKISKNCLVNEILEKQDKKEIRKNIEKFDQYIELDPKQSHYNKNLRIVRKKSKYNNNNLKF